MINNGYLVSERFLTISEVWLFINLVLKYTVAPAKAGTQQLRRIRCAV
jgi:hypothetical protein